MVLGIIVCISGGWWAYTGIQAPNTWRWVLGSLRSLLLLSLLLLLLGPVLSTPLKYHTPDQVLVLLDRSSSLLVEDVEIEHTEASRDDQVSMLLGNNETWDHVGRNRTLNWFGFHGHAFNLDPGNATTPELAPPTGSTTNTATAIEHALSRTGHEPVSAVVLISDGRSTNPGPPGFVSWLKETGIPVFTIPLGSTSSRGDLSIQKVKAPSLAYDNDLVPVVLELALAGESTNGVSGDILLVDEGTGLILDQTPISESQAPGETIEYTLVGTPTMSGKSTWLVTLHLDEPDLVSQNNEFTLDIELVNQPLRVLYIEGRPRWEYRYLKNLLLREETVESSTMLLTADRDFAQEGDRPITRLPANREEMEYWDILILGDVHSSSLTSEQSQAVTELVAEGRMSVAWIGGERWTPSSWAGSALVDLLPFTAPYQPMESNRQSHVKVLESANRLGIFQIENHDGDEAVELYDPSISWSGFQWTQRFDPRQIKPTTELLAVTNTSEPGGGVPFPLVMLMQFGSGSVAYVATDEFWRWRHGHGERLYEQFWIQLLRALGRNREQVDASGTRLVISPLTPEAGQPIRFELRVFDATLLTQLSDILTLQIRGEDGYAKGLVELSRPAHASNRYQGFWIPAEPGTVEAYLEHPGLDHAISEFLTITDLAGEMSVPAANHGALEAISNASGGRVIEPHDITILPTLIPDRSVSTLEIQKTPLWDSPWLFLVPLLLLGVEWLGRRYLRLA